jgi:hypothetical protein
MPGDYIGFSCSIELILQSDPFDPKTATSPRDLANALETELGRLRFTVRGDGHRVAEVHVYRIAPTYTAVRKALDLSTPWVKRRGVRKKR